jgi:uncharacterized BrkB/YihY/UPF0761 family membrane protein
MIVFENSVEIQNCNVCSLQLLKVVLSFSTVWLFVTLLSYTPQVNLWTKEIVFGSVITIAVLESTLNPVR